MKITISGMPGAGKSTLAVSIAKEFGFKRYYMGGMRRDLARKKNMTLEEFNKLGEKDISTDKMVDDFQKELGGKEDNIIVEGRTSFFLIPDSLKLFVIVDFDEGVKRVFEEIRDPNKAKERNETRAKDFNDFKKVMQERIKSDIYRYKKYYGIENAYDKKHFDLVIDTSGLTVEQTKEKIVKAIKDYVKKHNLRL